MDPEVVIKYGPIGILSVALTVLAAVVRFLYQEVKAERERSDRYIAKIEAQRDDYRTMTIEIVRSQERQTMSLDQLKGAVDRNTAEVARGRSGDRWQAQKG